MSGARIEIAASILNADLGALREAVEAAEAAGVLGTAAGDDVPAAAAAAPPCHKSRSTAAAPLSLHSVKIRPLKLVVVCFFVYLSLVFIWRVGKKDLSRKNFFCT